MIRSFFLALLLLVPVGCSKPDTDAGSGAGGGRADIPGEPKPAAPAGEFKTHKELGEYLKSKGIEVEVNHDRNYDAPGQQPVAWLLDKKENAAVMAYLCMTKRASGELVAGDPKTIANTTMMAGGSFTHGHFAIGFHEGSKEENDKRAKLLARIKQALNP